MPNAPKPPASYQEFVARYPKLGQAWEGIAQAGQEGPLDEKIGRLVKLAVAIGALRQGAVHSNVRKALATGCSREEIEQVVALAAATIGLPAAVAVFTWIRDVLEP
jgi:alkylhydroperoxidase/carboxymuconolactone decarboxylase family protein YurZ